VIIALVLLSGGNFAFALAHSDCFISAKGHITCEMECCKENPCAEEENQGEVQINDDSDSCCKIHIEQSMEQDITLPVIAKNPEHSKTFLYFINPSVIVNQTTGLLPVIHKFKTSNILLITSILRI
jgi:hypothetical protein